VSPSPTLDSAALRERLQLQLGTTFVISRELGGGGSSRVYLATESALERPVVLKVLPPELTVGVDAERFRREILFAARLQHPHLVPLLSAGSFDDELATSAVRWYSMPYVDGKTLRELLVQRGPLPLTEALRLLRELATALAYAHARGVVHRDIKPENVLMSDGLAMIADFGVAKALDDASDDALRTGKRVTTVSVTLGTPAYMAPEQVSSAKIVDHKADLYAFGCVAYELLTGEAPLARPTLRATLAAQLSEKPVPLLERRRDVPRPIADVIMRCLEKDPQQRPFSASVIVRELDGLTQPEAVPNAAPAPVATTDDAPQAARNAMLIVPLAVVVLIVTIWIIQRTLL
jgi:serine/threonine-protein kinase